jgi:UDP-glucose 4-epimerase
MKSKKVLVTGGAGYIGAHTVVELTNAGYDVVIIDNLSRSDRTLLDGIEKITTKKNNFWEGDCCDKKFVEKVFESEGPFSSVLHFAAYKSVGESVEKPLLYYQNNINSLIIMIEVMKTHDVTDFIFSSSCTVYGQPDKIPVNEFSPFKRAESAYGATKQMCERILEDTSARGLRVVSLRYFNPIGAHPTSFMGELPIGPPNNLVPYITQTAAGIREKLTIFGDDYNTPDGTCIRDYIHVVDLGKAHVKAMQYLAGRKGDNIYEAFNVGTGVGISVRQLVEKFKEATNVNLPYVVGPRRSGDVEKVFSDPGKILATLKWTAEFSIEESLLHAWQWEKKIRNIA